MRGVTHQSGTSDTPRQYYTVQRTVRIIFTWLYITMRNTVHALGTYDHRLSCCLTVIGHFFSVWCTNMLYGLKEGDSKYTSFLLELSLSSLSLIKSTIILVSLFMSVKTGILQTKHLSNIKYQVHWIYITNVIFSVFHKHDQHQWFSFILLVHSSSFRFVLFI